MPANKSNLAEKRLLSQATQGDKKAFGVLYERYRDEIYRYVFYRLGDQHEAEDITANAFLKTWEYLPRIHKRDSSIYNFRNWLYRVAKNLIIDYSKKKTALPLQIGSLVEQDSTKKMAELNIQSAHLMYAILKLKPDYQQIIILRFVNQLNHKEVAEIMELNTGQARVLQHRALKKLKELLSDGSDEY